MDDDAENMRPSTVVHLPQCNGGDTEPGAIHSDSQSGPNHPQVGLEQGVLRLQRTGALVAL